LPRNAPQLLASTSDFQLAVGLSLHVGTHAYSPHGPRSAPCPTPRSFISWGSERPSSRTCFCDLGDQLAELLPFRGADPLVPEALRSIPRSFEDAAHQRMRTIVLWLPEM